MLLFNFSFLDTAHRGGQNNSENYHLRGTEPFHRRDTFNINTLRVRKEISMPISMQTRTVMSDNSKTQATCPRV